MMTREDRHQQLDVLENKRRKGLIIRLYSIMVVGVFAVTLASSGVAYTHLLQTVAICVLLTSCVIGLVLIKRNMLLAASWVLAFLLLIPGVSSMFVDATPALYSSVFILMILLTGMIHSQRFTVGFGVLVSVFVVGVGTAHNQGLLMLRRPPEELGIIIMQGISILMVTVLMAWSSEGFRAAIRSLQSNQVRYFELFENSPVAILIISSACRVEYSNPAAVSLFVADLSGRHVRQVGIDGLLETLSRDSSTQSDLSFVSEKGEVHRVEVTTMRLSLPDGWTGWQVQLHDRVEVDRARSALQDTLEQLILAQRMESLGLFASGIAHDFNNLLTIILGNASLLGEDLPADDQEIIEEIIEAVDRSRRLAHQLISLGRNESSPAELINVGEHLHKYAFMLRRMISPRVRLELDITEGHHIVQLEPDRLEQIVSNLSINASHAMEGSGILRIQVSTSGDSVVVLIQDTGPGIQPEIIDQIFEPFFTTRSDESGTGLGLSVVRRIVDLSGGKIHAENRPEGCCFTVRLPRVDESPT